MGYELTGSARSEDMALSESVETLTAYGRRVCWVVVKALAVEVFNEGLPRFGGLLAVGTTVDCLETGRTAAGGFKV